MPMHCDFRFSLRWSIYIRSTLSTVIWSRRMSCCLLKDHSHRFSVLLYIPFCGLMQWTSGAYPESWTFSGTSLSEMMASVALPTSHHFHPSLSPVVSLTLGILHEWMRRQMLAKPSSNLLQRFGGNHQGGRAQVGWRTFAGSWDTWE